MSYNLLPLPANCSRQINHLSDLGFLTINDRNHIASTRRNVGPFWRQFVGRQCYGGRMLTATTTLIGRLLVLATLTAAPALAEPVTFTLPDGTAVALDVAEPQGADTYDRVELYGDWIDAR